MWMFGSLALTTLVSNKPIWKNPWVPNKLFCVVEPVSSFPVVKVKVFYSSLGDKPFPHLLSLVEVNTPVTHSCILCIKP